MGHACEKCGHFDSKVLETRADNRKGLTYTFLRRHRVCLGCGYRWYTYEVPASYIDEKPNNKISNNIKNRMRKKQ